MRILNQLAEQLPDVYYLGACLGVSNGLARRKLGKAIGLLGSAKAVYEAEENTIRTLGLFTEVQIRNHFSKRNLEYPAILRNQCARYGIKLITIYDDDYPLWLKQISDPPLLLYVLGELPKSEYSVAMVGSRACSDYGIKATKYFSNALVKEGIPIISGGARGIDTVAHEACLAAGGKTVAVLGCGLDVTYPEENKALFARITKNGALVSEYPPGVPPYTYNFPARNRIIVGLSQAVVVTEAANKSGALITAHLAADEGRDVYCVPGSIFSGKSIGCHELIRQGAKAIDTIADIVLEKESWKNIMRHGSYKQGTVFEFEISDEEREAYARHQEEEKRRLEAEHQAMLKALEDAKQKKLKSLSEAAQAIYACLGEESLGFDDLIELSGVEFTSVSIAVLDLQVAGLIVEEGLQKYHRI